MIGLFCRRPAEACRMGWLPRAALPFSLCLLMLDGESSRAQAQNTNMTAKMLIGDAVNDDEISRYPEVDDAIKRFINRDVLAARTFLEAAKKKNANLPPVDLILARMFFLTGNNVAGRVSLEKTASDNPDDPEPFLINADQAVSQGRIIEADALYDKSLALIGKFNGAPKRKRNFEIRARAGRSLVAQRRKKWEIEYNDLMALLQIDPENAMAHFRLGQALFMLKRDKEGYSEFGIAKEKDKNLLDKNVAAALMYDQLKNPERARQAFELALNSSRSDPNTIVQYAQWLIKSGSKADLEKAESLLAEARRSTPGNLELLIFSGVAARMSKKTKQAEDFFVEALGIAPAHGQVINQLALLLIEQPTQEKKDRAAQFAGMSAQLNQQSADAQITLAWVLFQLDRVTDARNALNTGLNLGTPSPDSDYLVARMLVAGGNIDDAKRFLKTALETDTPSIFVYRQEAQELQNKLNKP
jgi:tetratricopeptide (TPR) repeat protein